MAKKYGRSERTIQRKLDEYTPKKSVIEPYKVVVLTDTVYWERDFEFTVFKDAVSGQVLLKYYEKTESNQLYREGITTLLSKGFEVAAIVCDGRKGLMNSFQNTPVQMR